MRLPQVPQTINSCDEDSGLLTPSGLALKVRLPLHPGRRIKLRKDIEERRKESQWARAKASDMYQCLGYKHYQTRSERDACTPVFIEALFIIARTWKQPRCPSADERIRKLWYIYTMEYYSAIKKNSFESVLMRWMKLEPII